MTITEGTVDLTRDFPQPPQAVFAAWATKEAQLAWGDPGDGWEMTFPTFAFAVGQTDICRFGPAGGQQYVNENRYLVIEPDQRILYATSLAQDGRVGFAGTVAVQFQATDAGTRMRLIEQGLYLDDQDDVEGHRSGWEAMLAAMATYLGERG